MVVSQWYVSSCPSLPSDFLEVVRKYTPNATGQYLAQLLWQRGIREVGDIPAFLDMTAYQPTSPSAFGQEIKWAIKRLEKAILSQEKVTIWGDFDADGVTATSVLWEGLGQFFTQYLQLNYYIPNRFTESHGLNCQGIQQLSKTGTSLIVTCDTGSTNLPEIDYAHELGIDIIITDHHTLPEERPPVISILNSRYFAEHHPLYYLSGVAVAYKLVEGMYNAFPHLPQQPLDHLLDLVAIGLIADVVELKGECRYLAQKGIQQLQKQASMPTRLGVSKLLNLCKKSGDRATDISYGIGPRINAVSRIHGDARFSVELLTSKDEKYCQKLAEETELANNRRRALQNSLLEDVKKKLSNMDLSTTYVIVLENEQWQSGILGLVAGQIAQEYGRPTILLSTAEEENKIKLARGSARSVHNIDLYELVKSQSHLLHRFGGHPYAAGLSLPLENLSLFREGINQKLRCQISSLEKIQPSITVDLKVTVAILSEALDNKPGKKLFSELKLIEPCGMGNPTPKLLIENCWFTYLRNKNIQDVKNKNIKYKYPITTFYLWDNTVDRGFPGVWWGHSSNELWENQAYDVIVELDYNSYSKQYEVRLVEVRSHQPLSSSSAVVSIPILDGRQEEINPDHDSELFCLNTCPLHWDDLQKAYYQALQQKEILALAYSPSFLSPEETWKKLIGIVKYLTHHAQTLPIDQFKSELGLSDRSLSLALYLISYLGFQPDIKNQQLSLKKIPSSFAQLDTLIEKFLEILTEEQFQRQYFYSLPLSEIQTILYHTSSFDVITT